MPEEFGKCIPQDIQLAAEDRFSEYDKPSFSRVQTDIAKNLLKLRVSFLENQKIGKTYRADIKLLKKDTAIIIKSSDKSRRLERRQGTILGLDKLKQDWMKTEGSESSKIRYITAEQWQGLDEMAKLKLLSALIQ